MERQKSRLRKLKLGSQALGKEQGFKNTQQEIPVESRNCVFRLRKNAVCERPKHDQSMVEKGGNKQGMFQTVNKIPVSSGGCCWNKMELETSQYPA